MMKYIGIDPGINGGVAIIDQFYSLTCFKCPKSPQEMAHSIKEHLDGSCVALLEKVHSFPGQGVVSTFTFGANYGQWQGILSAFEIKFDLITPKVWQKRFQPLSKEKKIRKKELKEIAIKAFPSTKVTLYTSDAILLALYLRESYNEQ
jgi:hypothetical protein